LFISAKDLLIEANGGADGFTAGGTSNQPHQQSHRRRQRFNPLPSSAHQSILTAPMMKAGDVASTR